MLGGSVLTPPRARHRGSPRRIQAGVPGSEFSSTVGTGWVLLTPGGTKPAATWPCPGPRGRGWTRGGASLWQGEGRRAIKRVIEERQLSEEGGREAR